MNIFVLSILFSETAEFHCDKHCVKMILESTQLLYSAWHVYNLVSKEEFPHSDLIDRVYKISHKNHPCAIWIRESKVHYNWLLNMALALCDIYTARYNKIHKCMNHLKYLELLGSPPILTIEESKFQRAKLFIKMATINTPSGCDYFYCAIPDEIFEKCIY